LDKETTCGLETNKKIIHLFIPLNLFKSCRNISYRTHNLDKEIFRRYFSLTVAILPGTTLTQLISRHQQQPNQQAQLPEVK